MAPTPRPLETRFWPKVQKTETCWLWTASVGSHGYGQIWDMAAQRPVLAHRVSYALAYGTIPDGLDLDHLCRVRHCVNPAHLEAVTERENIIRGVSPGAIAVRTGKCRSGHVDWYVRPDGRRFCRECRRRHRYDRQPVTLR